MKCCVLLRLHFLGFNINYLGGAINKVKNFFHRIRVVRQMFTEISKLEKKSNINFLYEKYSPKNMQLKNTRTLDLGCGKFVKNFFKADRFYGVDIQDNSSLNIKKADLVLEDIPFETNSIDYITAYDFLEHIPRIIYYPERRLPFVNLMNAIYRVLKVNGIFLSYTPMYPFGEAVRDPTHVNYITQETFTLYFDNINKWASMYGFEGSFVVLEQFIVGQHLVSLLQKNVTPD